MMMTEQDETMKGLQTAIQMEIDGKEFYLKASRKSSDEIGKKLLASLAEEEDIHRQKFVEIYENIQDKEGWPRVNIDPEKDKNRQTVFSRAAKRGGARKKTLATELGTVKTAMAMENRTFDFYQARSKKASFDVERDFYRAIAAQERVHHQSLLDYYEYLQDPAAWFVKKEHPSLDGL